MADETLSVTFIVEDGTCVSGANSYISLEEANQYQTNKDRTDWLSLSDDKKEISLIKATQYINALYTWRGSRQFNEQELAFPRVAKRRPGMHDRPLIDDDGFAVTGIPKQIKDAVCEAAFYGYQSDSLFATYETNAGAIKDERKVVSGAVEKEIEYFSTSESESSNYISQYVALDKILKGLYVEKGYSNINARVDWGI